MVPPRSANRYERIIEHIFFSHFKKGAKEVPFERRDIDKAARALRVQGPDNPADLIYYFRHRAPLPSAVRDAAPTGHVWVIQPRGKGRHAFVAVPPLEILPNPGLAETKIPDATPGVIAMYSLTDEQALLAILRYNRLIDIFTGVASYSLQSHLRTTIPKKGQVETDEVYVGVDRKGVHYVMPVQAKGERERLTPYQIERDMEMCSTKFPELVCRPMGAQFMVDDLIALFEFEQSDTGLAISSEKHYRLVPPEELTEEELVAYRRRAD